MRRLLRTLWAALREISGEAALERRMACQCAASRKQAYEAAVTEQFGSGAHRCC
ncbi:MAG: hypothetical protein ACK46X_04185 [Candidatus Sericytochromatia bacterium]